MKLEEYLQQAMISQAAFGRRLGVSQGLVSHWIKGRVRITAEQAIEIERVTGGEVPRIASRPDLFGEVEITAPDAADSSTPSPDSAPERHPESA